MSDSTPNDILNLAEELRQKDALTDAYILPKENIFRKAVYGSHIEDQQYKFSLTKLGFPVHQLVLAAASPYFETLFKEHYAEHKDSTITVMVPEASAPALHCILLFIYTTKLNLPEYLFDEVVSLAHTLKISHLLSALDSREPLSILKVFPYRRLLLTQVDRKESNNLKVTNLKNTKVSSLSNNNQHLIINKKLKSSSLKIKDIDNFTLDNPFTKDDTNEYNTNDDKIDSFICNDDSRQLCTISSDMNSGNNLKKVNLSNYSQPSSHTISNSSITAHPNSLNFIYSKYKGSKFPASLNPETTFVNVCPNIVHPSIKQNNMHSSPDPLPMPIQVPSTIPLHHFKVETPSNIMCTSIQKDLATNQTSLPTSFVPSPLESTEEDEEKFLRLQVLLKDCEDMDFRVSNTYESQTPTEQDFIFIKKEENPTLNMSACSAPDFKFPPKREIICADDLIASDDSRDHLIKPDKRPASTIGYSEDEIPSAVSQGIKNADLKCKFCQSSYDSPVDLQAHLLQIHQKERFFCHLCSKSFGKKYDLVYHQIRHKEPTLPCPVCGKLFKLKKDLAAHQTTHKNDPNFECSQCGKLLSSSRNLKLHIDGVHQRRKPFPCSHCDKNYTKKVDLLKHIRQVHTGEKPYKCDICDEAFHSAGSLYYHKDVHLSGAKFSCKSCPRVFKTRIKLISHNRTHIAKHRAMKQQVILCEDSSQESTNIKKIRCRFCRGSFKSPERFEDHVQKFHRVKVKVAKIKVKPVTLNKTNESMSSSLEDKFQSITVIPLTNGNNSV